MDAVVEELVNKPNQPTGLYTEGANYRIWVRRWAEVLEEKPPTPQLTCTGDAAIIAGLEVSELLARTREERRGDVWLRRSRARAAQPMWWLTTTRPAG